MAIKTRTRYTMLGSDYSSQEPRLLGAYSQDPSIYQIFAEDKDMYSAVASIVYKNDYDQNREFFPDGTFNLEGKQRRSACKSVILG